MAMATDKTMKTLYGKLHEAGFNPKFVKSLLPEWWDDRIASTQSGFQEASIRLGSIFGVKPSSLRDPAAPPALRVPEGRRFKHQANHKENQLDLACALAMSAASRVLKVFPRPETPVVVPDAKIVRDTLLAKHPYINFAVLLDYVWQLGIPVIHIEHWPTKAKKMAGLAFEQNGRPVIILTSNRQHGFLVFDLAHELAHIALGHVTETKSVVDQDIDEDADDPDERAANRFALEFLTGDPGCKIVPTGRHLTGAELAAQAARYGENRQIDPLHVALNYGHTLKQWVAASAAVKILAHHTPSDQEFLRKKLFGELEEHDINDDDFMVLARLTGEAVE